MKRLRYQSVSLAVIIASSLALGACSFIVDPQFDEDMTGPGKLTFGETCSADEDCGSDMCQTRRCSQSCSDSELCPGGGIADCDSGTCRFLVPPAIDGPLKMGILYVGPVGDHGWTLTHERSRIYASEQIPTLESDFAPSVAAADAPGVIDDFIAGGHNVIVGTSFDFLVPFQNRAANNPDINFLLCSGFQTTPNLGSYFGRMYQVLYMAGVLAGRMTVTNKIGVVGPVVLPETVRHVNAFTQGVRSVNPEAKVYVRWAFAWFAPDAEVAATNELLAADVDVIMGNTDTTIPLEVSKTATTSMGTPVYSIGYDNKDSCDFAPERCLTSAYWNWGPMLTRTLNEMADGSWMPGEAPWDQMESSPERSPAYLSAGGANNDLINATLVPTNVRIEVESLIPTLTADTNEARMLPFKAPVVDNMGMERVSAGQSFTDQDLLSMCWFVDGVFDTNELPAVVPSQCVGTR